MRLSLRSAAALLLCLCCIFPFLGGPAVYARENAPDEKAVDVSVLPAGFEPGQVKALTPQGLYIYADGVLRYLQLKSQKLTVSDKFPKSAELKFFMTDEAFFTIYLSPDRRLSLTRYRQGKAEDRFTLSEDAVGLPMGYVTARGEWIYKRIKRTPAKIRGFRLVEEDVLRLNLHDFKEMPVRTITYIEREGGTLLGRRITAMGGDSDNVYLAYEASSGYPGQRPTAEVEKLEFRTSYERAERIVSWPFDAVPVFAAGSGNYVLLGTKPQGDSPEALTLKFMNEAAFQDKLTFSGPKEGEAFVWSLTIGERIFLGRDNRLLVIKVGEKPRVEADVELKTRPFLTTKGAFSLELEGGKLRLKPIFETREAGK